MTSFIFEGGHYSQYPVRVPLIILVPYPYEFCQISSVERLMGFLLVCSTRSSTYCSGRSSFCCDKLTDAHLPTDQQLHKRPNMLGWVLTKHRLRNHQTMGTVSYFSFCSSVCPSPSLISTWGNCLSMHILCSARLQMTAGWQKQVDSKAPSYTSLWESNYGYLMNLVLQTLDFLF